MRVTDGYFESVGTKIVKGRTITEQDTATTRNVAVVNQTFAKKFFKDEDPIGKHFGDLDQKYAGAFEIVGVTEDTQYRGPNRQNSSHVLSARDPACGLRRSPLQGFRRS